MVRSAAAVLAVLILPGFALGQEPQGTHTVVDGDTLWDLAQLYYENPFEWRVIWNANRDVVEDPNWIYPDEVLVIPGLPGPETPVTPDEPGPDEPTPDEPVEDVPDVGPEGPEEPSETPVDLAQVTPDPEVRTIFYRDTSEVRAGVVRGQDVDYVAVSADAVFSAPWVVGFEGDPAHSGVLTGFAARGARASTIRSFDRVSAEMYESARVGDQLQIFRVTRTIEDVGRVAKPTGVLTVAVVGDGEVVGVVTKEYDRIQPGDFVRPLPAYRLRPGQYARPVSGGSEAMVMGFEGQQVLNDLGHVAFIDLGSDDGITIGDEFVLYGTEIPTATEGALQVIGVTEHMAAARILAMSDNVFTQGVVVRLSRKMR